MSCFLSFLSNPCGEYNAGDSFSHASSPPRCILHASGDESEGRRCAGKRRSVLVMLHGFHRAAASPAHHRQRLFGRRAALRADALPRDEKSPARATSVSASSWQEAIVPPGGAPAPPECELAKLARRRCIPLRPDDASRERPSSSGTKWVYSRIGILSIVIYFLTSRDPRTPLISAGQKEVTTSSHSRRLAVMRPSHFACTPDRL